MIALLAAVAFAQDDAVCDTSGFTAPPATLSVAWVSPLRKRAGANAWLYVVPTSDLRAFAAGEGKGAAGRTLQWLGLRRTSKEPRRSYKVVVFEATADDLCRPVATTEEELGGVRACDENRSGPDGAYDGCGFATDRADGQPSVQLYRAQWRMLSVDGFCVLPLDRFLLDR